MSIELGNVAATVLVAVAVAMLARRRGWGIALPLIGVGALMSVLPVGPNAPDSPEIFQIIVLAPLVFGEALGSSYIDIRKVRRPVMALAIGLVAATTLVVGGVMAVAAVAIPAAMCFALGAVVAPTDAVAVATAARRANLPQRLVLILEGESLVNDGTGLTALRVAITAAVAGSVTLAEAGGILAQSVLVGVGVGVVTGFVLVWVLRRSSDLVGSGGLLLVAPFVIYVLAEELGGSEILAIVVAGLMASHSTHSDPSYRGRLQVAIVWKQITFLLQAVAFLLLGLDLPVVLAALTESEQTSLLLVVPLVVVALIATRLLFVTAMIATSKWGPGTQKSDWRHGTVM
ncbi:MAG: monovalent cation/hydrogen antiporter, partial [Actinomycetota bacterium]|nr:monovalent cation/hydrogen antiporter [Actinomycetota bacterium]